MSIYNVPRCQHLKVNGIQCGSPALKRNRFCFFHKRFQEEQIKLNSDRRGRATFYLPVLEDANSIQVSLMQVMRLLATGQIDAKIAGMFLYALQTASVNLRHVTFEPITVQNVVIDRGTIDETAIGCYQWSAEDFPDDEPTEEELAALAAEEAEDAAVAARAAVRARARRKDALEAEADRLSRRGDPTAAAQPPSPDEPPDPIIPPIGAPRYSNFFPPAPAETVKLVRASAPIPAIARSPTIAALAPAVPPTQLPAQRAVSKKSATALKQSATDSVHQPATAKLGQKKSPRKATMDEVRQKIRGMARDWIVETARQSNSHVPPDGKPRGHQARQ
jgi:hypothetical protein